MMGASKAASRLRSQAATGEAWQKSAKQSYSFTAMRCVHIRCLDPSLMPDLEASFSGNLRSSKPIYANGKEAYSVQPWTTSAGRKGLPLGPGLTPFHGGLFPESSRRELPEPLHHPYNRLGYEPERRRQCEK